ncbi:MAG TPA: NUDIX domain-containing protein [Ignavibacteria bacterium]|nr:NUDIX domain-containing protein [Ignavibacteria bacterium]
MKLATLLYIKNSKNEFLLLERAKNPNKGLLSPPGGKLKTDIPESPFACAVREANEECGLNSKCEDWKLRGIITEYEYPELGNIMIFIMEYLKPYDTLPEEFSEGKFSFVSPEKFENLNIPETDKLFLWNFVLNNKSFFSVHIDCSVNPYKLTTEQI